MSPYYAKLEVPNKDIKPIYELLSKDFGNIFHSLIETDGSRVAIIIGTKWFFKTNSDASITILIREHEDRLILELISYGGREGVFGLSLGVNEDFVRNILKALRKNEIKYNVLVKMNYSNPSRIKSLSLH